MKPCMGGRGPGSCVGGKKGAGERRSERVGLPENTVKHTHAYQWVRDYDEILKDGKKTWKYFYQEFKCIATRGKCNRPQHIDYIRRVRVDLLRRQRDCQNGRCRHRRMAREAYVVHQPLAGFAD